MKYQYWEVFYVIQPPLRKTMQVIIELIQHVEEKTCWQGEKSLTSKSWKGLKE